MTPFPLLRAAVVACIVLAMPAADLTLASPGWEERSAKDAKAVFTRANGLASISVGVARFARFEVPFTADGSDDAPLRIESRVAISGEGPLRSHPALLTLAWPGALLTVGVIPGEGVKFHQRTAVARWVTGGARGEARGAVELYPDGAPAFLRLVVSTRDVSAWASSDGWIWQRLATLPRAAGAFAGAPVKLAVGKGWPGEKDGLSLDIDIEEKDKAKSSVGTYSFLGLRATNELPVLPSSLLKTYSKGASREETLDQLFVASQVRQWWIAGPFPARKAHDLTPIGPEKAGFDQAATFASGDQRIAWKEHVVGDGPNDHIVIASSIVPGDKDQVRFAATVIECDEPRVERFLFDGKQQSALYVDGQLIAYEKQEKRNAETEVDRNVVLAPLVKGRNTVVLMVSGDDKGRSTFTLRHEPGDPRYRIALLKRLALDFPDDTEAVIAGLQESARLWEHLGFLAEAARTCSEVANVAEAPREQIEAALLERARLHAQVRDQTSIDADIRAVQQHWANDTDADQLTVFQRTAQLWQRLDQDDKALAALGDAAKLAGLSDDARLDLGLERLRLIAEKNDPAALRVELREVANSLPAESPMRAMLFAEVADRMLWAQQKPDRELAIALKSTNPRALRRAAGVAIAANDKASWLAALKAIAALPTTSTFDSPHVMLAETLAEAGDAKGAIEAYRQAIARLPAGQQPTGKDADDLNALRSAFIRGTLAETPAGAQLIADSAKAAGDERPQTPDVKRWWTIGPFDNAEWKCYANPPVKPDTVDVQKPVGQLKWIQPEARFYSPEAVLDLKGVYNADNCVAFCFTEIASPVAGAATLTMGADDGLVVWMNGAKVHEDRDQRGVTLNSIQVPVTLKKGANRLLCMVQNGGSGHGIQCRLVTAGSFEISTASTVRFALAKPDQRGDIATALQDGVEMAYQGGRVAEAAALIRVLLRAFPDRWDSGSAVAWKFTDGMRMAQDPQTARQALLWEEATAPLHPRGEATAVWIGDIRWGVANCLTQLGDYEASGELLRAAMWSKFDARSQGHYRLRLGEIYLFAGYLERAAMFYKRVLAIDGIDQVEEWLGRTSRDRLSQLRRVKGAIPTISIPFDTTTALRTAERSIETGDFARAIASFQQAISANPGQAVPIGGGRYQGMADWCADRLRLMPAEGVDVYRASQGSAAAQIFATAVADDDVEALERLASQYPISGQAADALTMAARRYLARGADALAAATVDRLVREFQIAEPERSQLLAAALRAAARAGERGLFAGLAKEFSTNAKPVVDGAAVDAKAWLAEVGKVLAPATADPAPTAAIGAAAVTLVPEHLRDLRRFVGDGMRTVHVVPVAGSGAGMAYLNTGVDGVLLELATGAVRWRTVSDRVPGQGVPDSGFTGLPEAGAVVAGGRCVARIRREGRWCLEARDAATSALMWSSEGVRELTGMTACSSPSSDGARVLAMFSNNNQLAMAAFSLTDGRLAWFTPLSLPKGDLGLFGGSELGFDLAAPTIAGREAYIATNGGAVVAIDTGSGFLRWVSTYARAVVNPSEGRHTIAELLRRPVSRVLVSGDRLMVLPHDTLGLLCLSRTDGTLVWRRDFPGGRSLAGVALTPAGERLVLQGDDVKCLDGANGRLVWQWQPRDGATIGTGAVGAASVAVASAGSLHRLALADGALLGSTPWKDLGVSGSVPGNLRWAGDRLVATGNGGVAILAPGAKPAAKLPLLAPSLARSEREVLPTIGVKPAAAGAAMALAWRLACAPIVRFDRPADAQPGDAMLQTRETISRIDLLAPAVAWSTPISADTRTTITDRDGVLVVGLATLTMLGREDGAVRWCEPVDPDTIRPLVSDFRPEVVLGEHAVLVYMTQWSNTVDVRDRKTGKRIRRIEVRDSGILAAGEQGGKLCVLYRRHGKVWSELFDLATGQSQAATQVPISADNVMARNVPGGSHILISGAASGVVEIATGVGKALSFPLHNHLDMQRRGSQIEIWSGGDGKGASWTLWELGSDKAIFQEKVVDGWFDWSKGHVLGYRRSGDRLVRVASRDNKSGIQAKGIDGKDLWWTPSADQWRRNYIHLAVGDTHAYSLFVQDGEQRIEVLNLADGKVAAASGMPGWAIELNRGSLVVGDTWVVVGENQLIGLAPAAPEALAQLPIDQSVPVPQRYLRGLMSMPAAGPTAVMPLSAARSTITEPAEIRRWKTIGPFPNDAYKPFTAPPVDPTKIDTKQKIGELAWIEPAAKDYAPGWLDLTSAYPGSQNCVYFCYAEITSAADVRGILSMGADDSLIVWLNGKQIYDDKDARGVTPNSIEIPMALKQGRNTLLCGIANGGGPGGIQCQVVTFTKVDQSAATTWFTDWAKLPPVALGLSSVRIGAPAEARAHFAHDPAALYVAVEVADGTPYPRPRGGAPLAGDGVVVGIDGRDENRVSAVVLALHDPEGLPRVDLIAGTWAADPAQAGEPILRVQRGSGRQVYLVAIPWGLLRRDTKQAANRPRLDLGLAVIDRTTTGELGMRVWGAGLVDGFSPRTWPSINLLPGK